MKKLSLAVIGLYVGLLSAFSQNSTVDSSQYKSRKLTFEEANFVSSYYHQDGNNSAVTGGIGTEKLTDFANSFEVRLKRYDRRNRKHTFDVEVGIDHYTSASSDKIDPHLLQIQEFILLSIGQWKMKQREKHLAPVFLLPLNLIINHLAATSALLKKLQIEVVNFQ
jgi:hypothetical protein